MSMFAATQPPRFSLSLSLAHPHSSPRSWQCDRGRAGGKTRECVSLPLSLIPAGCRHGNRSLGRPEGWREWSPISEDKWRVRDSVNWEDMKMYVHECMWMCVLKKTKLLFTFGWGPKGSVTSPESNTNRCVRLCCVFFVSVSVHGDSAQVYIQWPLYK